MRIVSRFGPIATCRLKTKEIIRTREAENVLSLKAAVRLAPEKEPDDSYGQFDFPRNTSQNRLRRPKELSQTGAGVVIGIVDFGCDFNHPDLKNEDGSTRLLALWDQGGNGSTSIENKFGYGTIFTRQHIDWALREPNPYRALGYQPGIAAHGTHVTGIAAGNGLGGGPAGVAPEADIVFVHMASKGTGGLSNLGNSVRLLEAIDFVTEIAQNRPWVINLSVGLHGGPHDGCTPVEMALDHLLLGGPNRFIVQSTGNYFNKDIHASGRLREGEVRALRIIIDETDQTPNELEIWYAAGDEFIVKTESPNGTKSKSVRLGKSSEVLENGRIVGMLYNRKNDPNNSDHLINLFLDPIASSGEWIVHIKALRASNGVYHAWLERDDCPGCQPRFAAKQSNKFYTTGTLANGHIPLVVGAYNAYSRKREAPPFSSVGPTRDNRQKPDLVGPGVHELAARSDANPHKWNSELYTRKSGTSMAAPHVTGTVALCLEASSRPLSCHEIRKLILGNTENVSNNVKYPIRYGHGYLDIAKAIRSTLALSTPSKVQKEFPTTSLKEVVYPEKTNIMKEKINEAIAEIDNLLVLSTLEGSKIDLLAEIMQPSERSRSTICTDPDELYGNIVYKRNGQISKTIAKNFEVLALPGESLEAPPQRGDLLLRAALGDPGLGHVAMISESTLTSDEELSEFALASESQQPGFYSTIIEGGSFPHTLRDFFARRILDHNGEMPAGQVLLRPRLFNVKENYEESFDEVNNTEDISVIGASRFFTNTTKASIATIGFEFDIHFGLLEPVVDAKGVEMPEIGDKITNHEDSKDGFHVKLDGPRFEIATKPFTIDNKGKKEFNSTILNILKFSNELKKRCRDFGKPKNIDIPGVKGKPRPFTHPKTLIKDLPITRLPFKKRLRKNCRMWASPQATITIPLSRVTNLITIIKKSEGKGRGVALTGDKKGNQPRMGLRSLALYKAMVVVNKSRNEIIANSAKLKLSDGTIITSLTYSENFRGFLILLVSYLFTSELTYDFSEPNPADYEALAKAYLPINVKTPFHDIFQKLLSTKERLLFRELYANRGRPRQRLFKLVDGKVILSSGNKKLFPPGRIELGRGIVFNRQTDRFGKVPTWNDLIDHTLDSSHESWGRRLIVSDSKMIGIDKTNPRVALELRRIGFNAVFDFQWKYLMRRIFSITKKLNS